MPPLPPSTRTRTAHLTVLFSVAIVRTRPNYKDLRLGAPTLLRAPRKQSVRITRLSKNDRGSSRSLPLSKNGRRQNDAIHCGAQHCPLFKARTAGPLALLTTETRNAVEFPVFATQHWFSRGWPDLQAVLVSCLPLVELWNSNSPLTAGYPLWLAYMAKFNLHWELPFPLFSIVIHDEVPRLP
jgi:hypothetical protein